MYYLNFVFTVIYTYPCFICIIKLKEKGRKWAKENSYHQGDDIL